jgi:hypothetical protein
VCRCAVDCSDCSTDGRVSQIEGSFNTRYGFVSSGTLPMNRINISRGWLRFLGHDGHSFPTLHKRSMGQCDSWATTGTPLQKPEALNAIYCRHTVHADPLLSFELCWN